MSETTEDDNRCDYNNCDSQAYRHFWMHHFCNEHNWYLRKKAQRENVELLDEYIESHTE